MNGKSYLVDLGNSNAGPIGACIRVTVPASHTKVQVAQEVCKFLDKLGARAGIDIGSSEVTHRMERRGVEYIRVFFNPEHITVREISEGDTEGVDKIEN